MSLFKKVMSDWVTAFKAKAPEKAVLTEMKAELQTRAKNDLVDELSDDVVIGVLGKLSEVFKESLDFAKQANRDDLVEQINSKITALQSYLPTAFSEDELMACINASIVTTGATSVKDFSKVMKVLMPQVKGRADGALVSKIAKELLSK